MVGAARLTALCCDSHERLSAQVRQQPPQPQFRLKGHYDTSLLVRIMETFSFKCGCGGHFMLKVEERGSWMCCEGGVHRQQPCGSSSWRLPTLCLTLCGCMQSCQFEAPYLKTADASQNLCCGASERCLDICQVHCACMRKGRLVAESLLAWQCCPWVLHQILNIVHSCVLILCLLAPYA